MKQNISLSDITIPLHFGILSAMQKMDKLGIKSLIISENNLFSGILTIGDIQRAIIANKSFDETVMNAVAERDFIVCDINQNTDNIKQKMLEFRTDFMPIIDKKNKIVNVIFWKDIFGEKEIVENSLPKNINVVIMAGGFGTRLKPLTFVIPKPLIPIGEKSILEEIIYRFSKIGVNDFHLSVNYKFDLIKFYLNSKPEITSNINYIKEDQPLGTAGSLFLLKNKINNTLFITNCDILIDQDYTQIFKYHQENKNDITIVASLKSYKIPYGTIESGDSGELISLKEKPELVFMINTGMYLIEPDVLNTIEDNKHLHITELIENTKANGGKVGVFPISEGSWTDIGEWNEYNKIIDAYK